MVVISCFWHQQIVRQFTFYCLHVCLHYLAIYRCQRHEISIIRCVLMRRIQQDINRIFMITGQEVILFLRFFLSFKDFRNSEAQSPKIFKEICKSAITHHPVIIKIRLISCQIRLIKTHRMMLISYLQHRQMARQFTFYLYMFVCIISPSIDARDMKLPPFDAP